jgi:hypothetical protein
LRVQRSDRIEMSQRERDRLRILHDLKARRLKQTKAAELLDLTIRQVRRLLDRWTELGDPGLIHGLRGRPSNRSCKASLRRRVLARYRKKYADFGPTLASEKLASDGLVVSPDTLRRWLLAEGLWQRRRRRDVHRQRRPRRSCFGELVQMDTSIHDWTEGRGESMVLITMIDDATSRLLARFYPSDTVEAHFDLLGRWLVAQGRPRALYTDRHSIFESQKRGVPDAEGETQFGRALAELDIELIRARSPQAKGRVERSFGTAQDRWVKEMRLAKVRTIDQANALLERLLPDHNRRFAVPAADEADGHRAVGKRHHLAAILSVQTVRVVSNDYVVRLANRFYQLDKPIYPGERGGKVVVEMRLDGTMAIRLGDRYLNYHEIETRVPNSASADSASADSASADSASADSASAEDEEKSSEKKGRRPSKDRRSPGVKPTGGRSGRTPAEPYPPDGKKQDKTSGPHRPRADHPWRRSYKGFS